MLGYIKQDVGGMDILVMPAQCSGFGGILPPAGTRVKFDVVLDPMLAMLRAESVQPETLQFDAGTLDAGAAVAVQPQQVSSGALLAVQPHAHQFAHAMSSLDSASVTGLTTQLGTDLMAQLPPTTRSYSEGRKSGIFEKEKGSYGFITQDTGEPEMFVMPRACGAFGGTFPPLGTRVVFEVVASDRTGKPRAENVRPGFSGTMAKVKGNYGFITQDNGEPEMFVMPRGCAYFNDAFPPIGTRVVYEIVASDRTGKPRAEDVQPMFKQSVTPSLSLQNVSLGALPAGPSLVAAQQEVNLIPELAQSITLFGLSASDSQEHVTVPDGPSAGGPESASAEMQANENFSNSKLELTSPDDEQSAKRRKILES